MPGIAASSTATRPAFKVEDESKVGEVRRLPIRFGTAKALAFSPNGGLLAVGQFRTLTVFDLNSGAAVGKQENVQALVRDVTALAFSPDGRKLLAGGVGKIEVWNVDADGKLSEAGEFSGHAQAVNSITVSYDSQHVLSGGDEKKARYWNLDTFKEEFAVEGFNGRIKATYLSRRAGQGLACDGQTLALIDISAGKIIQTMTIGSYASQGVDIAADGSCVAEIEGHAVRVWEIRSGRERPRLENSGTLPIWSSTFSPDGKRLIFGGRGMIALWDVESSQKISEFSTATTLYVQAVAYSPDGRHAAAIPVANQDFVQVFQLPAPASP